MRDALSGSAGGALFSIRRRMLWPGIAACLVVAMGTTSILTPRPRLIWNASASAPVGLWRVAPDAPFGRGD
ncbi:MAG TPA: hypothetical protein VN034_11750, partial [Sphingopyxis sp.]|nr:hypothetical protein [Sphingopyxis sp.]